MIDSAFFIATSITFVVVLVGLLVGMFVVVRSLKRAEEVVAAIETTVADIDKAVNGVEEGEATIRENVQDIHDNEFPEKIPPPARQIVDLIKSEVKKIEQPPEETP